MTDVTEHPRYKEARRRARDLRGFYVHALVYCLVMGGLVTLNLLTSPGRLWVMLPAAGWGIGVLAHGASVVFPSLFGAAWEERKIREYLERRP